MLAVALIFVIPTHADEPDQSHLNEFYSVIRSAIEQGKSDVSIAHLNINRSCIDTYYRSFIWENPDISFCVSKTLYYKYAENTGIVASVTLIYDNSETISARKEWLCQAVKSITKNIDPNWTDLQKMLWINDYICDNYRYDIDSMNRTAYDLLKTGNGICEGYTALFTLLAQECEIPVSYCFSQKLQHIWNMVMLDGEWYHIDTTWNDSYTDRYEYFLLSDMENQISRGGSHDTNQLHLSTSDKYDNAFWRSNIYSSFVFDESDAYFIHGNKLTKVNLSTFTTKPICILANESWKEPNTNYYYVDRFYDLTNIGDLLIYNTASEIYAYSIPTEKHFLLKSFVGQEEHEIYAIRYDSSKLIINQVSNIKSDLFDQKAIEAPVTYTITYYLEGSVYDIQTYCIGMSLVYPKPDPFRSGYVFAGWSIGENTNVERDATLYPIFDFDSSKCNIVFISNEEPYQIQSVNVGETIPLPKDEPIKESDAYYTYKFVGWKNYYDGIVAYGSTMVFIATYEEELRTYTVNFFDGEKLKSSIICNAGTLFESVQKPSIENKCDESGNNLIFKGWSVNNSVPAEKILDDINAYAVYEIEKTYITIDYYNGDILFNSQIVESGSILEFIKEIPEKIGTDDYIYIFDKWVGYQEGTAIYTNTILHANYRQVSLQDTQQAENQFKPIEPDNIDNVQSPSKNQHIYLTRKILLLSLGASLLLIVIVIRIVRNRRHN